MKKALSVLLTLAMLVAIFTCVPVTASAKDLSDITFTGESSQCFKSLLIDGYSISNCTERMSGPGWTVVNDTIFLNNYNGSGITAKMKSDTTSVLSVVVVTNSTITDDMFGIYSNVGLKISGLGDDAGGKLNINAGYVGINCSGLLGFYNGIYTVKCTDTYRAYAGIVQAHYIIEHTTIASNAMVFVDWKATAANDIYGIRGFYIAGSNSTEANPHGEVGKLSVSVENYGSGNAYAHNMKDSWLDDLKLSETVYPSDEQHFFLNMVGIDRLDLTVDAPKVGNYQSKQVALKQSYIGAELVGWLESGSGVFMSGSATYKARTEYIPRFLINPSSFCKYYPDVAVTVNGVDANFNIMQANNTLVITGISFNTGSTEIKEISVKVTAPVACKSPDTTVICETPGCSVTGVYWFDSATDTEVGNYQTLQPQKQYEVRIFVKTSEGYELDTSGSFVTKVNGNNAVLNKIMGNSEAMFTYTFETLPKVTFNSVTIEGNLVQGEAIGGHLTYPNNMSVSAIQWYRNGAEINEAKTATRGSYYATITLNANTGFFFDNSTAAYAFGEEGSDYTVSNDGTMLQFNTPTFTILDDSGTCGENLTYSYNASIGVLTISGTGDMNDYTSSTVPWKDYRDNITSVIVEDGVTSIGNSAFEYCDNLTTVTLGNDVANIGNYAFNSCDNLSSINLPDSVTNLGLQVFSGTARLFAREHCL